MTTKFVTLAHAQDADSFVDTFNAVVAEKVTDALASRKQELAQGIFGVDEGINWGRATGFRAGREFDSHHDAESAFKISNLYSKHKKSFVHGFNKGREEKSNWEKNHPRNEETVSEEYHKLSDTAKELVLHADNDSHLHRSSHEPIMKNLAKKHAKGVYDSEKAKKLWGYHADRAAASYHKEYSGVGKWHEMFPKRVRDEAASHWEEHHREDLHEGAKPEWSDHFSNDRESGAEKEKAYHEKIFKSRIKSSPKPSKLEDPTSVYKPSAGPFRRNEEVEKVDEVSLKTAVNAIRSLHNTASDYEASKEDSKRVNRFRNKIARKWGKKGTDVADKAVDAPSTRKYRQGENDLSGGLRGTWRTTTNLTKRGKVPASTQRAMKDIAKHRNINGPNGKLPKE
jgi:hypothetical protein